MKISSLILLFCAMVIFCLLTACAAGTAGTASFYGFVTDRDTQVPLKGATVRNLCQGDGSNYSGVNCFGPVVAGNLGWYRLKLVPGNFSIRATKSGYNQVTKAKKVPTRFLNFKLKRR